MTVGRAKKVLSFILIFAVIISAACTAQTQQSDRERAAQIVENMSTEEKIGQVIALAFEQWIQNGDTEPSDFTEMNDEVRTIISDYHLGNVILFGQNCVKASDVARLTYDIQKAATDSGTLPLLIMTDAEGGSVYRLADGCATSGNMALAMSGDTENIKLAGKIMGSELSAVGINCDLAPVADVNSNRNNPVIGIRSFSDDPHIVSEYCSIMIDSLKGQGIIPCVKHFPGHGNTNTDSHTGLPLVETDYESWYACDCLPFRELIGKKSVDMIMTAHIQYPGLDDTKVISAESGEEIYLPATLSKKILTDILKGMLGFDGVVITDALRMDAIVKNFGQIEAVIMALNAGADLILMPVELESTEDRAKLDSLYQAIEDAISDGTLPEERLDDAAKRVVWLKIKSGILDADYNFDINAAAERAASIVGGEENRRLERLIADNCTKLFYDGDFVPFAPGESEKVLVLASQTNYINSAKYAFLRMEHEGVLKNPNVIYDSYQNMTELTDELIKEIEEADYIILNSHQTGATVNDESSWLNVAPKLILQTAKTDRVAIFCTGLPYQTEKYAADYPCFVLCSTTPMNENDVYAERITHKYGPMIPAGIEAIFGR